MIVSWQIRTEVSSAWNLETLKLLSKVVWDYLELFKIIRIKFWASFLDFHDIFLNIWRTIKVY